MSRRYWKVNVEFIFPVFPEELKPRHPGDVEQDLADRVVDERFRPALEALLQRMDPGAHYYIEDQHDNDASKPHALACRVHG